jgi:hypothetical protein
MQSNLEPSPDRIRKMAIPVIDLLNATNGLNPKYADAFKRADVIFGYDTSRSDGETVRAVLAEPKAVKRGGARPRKKKGNDQ